MRFTWIAGIPTLLFLVSCAAGRFVSEKEKVQLKQELGAMVIADQVAAKMSEGKYKDYTAAQWAAFTDSVFGTHKLRLEQLFTRYGFPGYDLVGEEGSKNFWLMVQHCDHWPDFQLKVLDAMDKEVKRHNADPKNYAYLTDRVRVNTGQKQLYGTQLQYKKTECQAIPKPMSDSLNVNLRRKALGMEPIELYLNRMTQFNFQMNKARYEAAGITAPTLLPVPGTAQ